MSTHSSGTLSFPIMNSILDSWEEEDAFKADIILSDYIDIMEADPYIKEFRQKENRICKCGT